MVYARTSIPDFSLANAYYALATVTAYEVDEDGAQTTTLAPLYEQPVGTARLTNPQTLDSEGKFVRPVYIDRDVMLIVSGRTVGSHGTGVITVPVFTDCLMDTFTGDGSTTVFTLSREAYVTTFLEITIDGATQQPDAAYGVSGLALTFTEAPPLNGEIFVIHSVTTATASTGPVGPTGPGVPTGGSTGQVLAKVSGTSFDTAWATPATVSSVTMGGDLSGSSSAATVTKLQNIAVSTTDPTSGQLLAYDGSEWAPASPDPVSNDLLKISNSGSGIDATLRSVVDGAGDTCPIQVSTSAVRLPNNLILPLGDSTKFTDGRTGVLIPAYISPASPYANTVVQGLLALIRTYRTVPFLVIINPASGPGTYDADYAHFIQLLKGAGARVLGYVATGYGVTAEATVKADIDSWLSLYSATPISGCFLDEMPYDLTVGGADMLALYGRYTSYAHSKNLWPVCCNPGTNQQESWFSADPPTADIIVVHEGSSYPVEADMQGNFIGGHSDYSFTKRAALVYGQVGSLNTTSFRILAKYCQYAYVTHDGLSNPWDSISTSLEEQLLAITGTGAATSMTVGGDLSGTTAAATVIKLQARAVAATSPSDLQYLGWNNGASQWEPKTISATTSVTMTGDVSGNSGSNSVDKIKAVAVSATAPTTGQTLTYSGSAWAPATPYSGYDIPLFIPDSPTASQISARIVAVRGFSLPSGLTGSQASAGTASTGTATFTLKKNGSSVGTVVFTTSATGVLAMASSTSFAAGDVLEVIAPSSADATLANISISLTGTRT